jgi:hypothetical protein
LNRIGVDLVGTKIDIIAKDRERLELVSKPLSESTVFALTLHIVPTRTGEREKQSFNLVLSPSPILLFDPVRVGVTSN